MPKTARAILQMPPATVAAIEKLGADLAVARLRRKESLKTWAQRMGVSVPTLQRLEAGDPHVLRLQRSRAVRSVVQVQNKLEPCG